MQQNQSLSSTLEKISRIYLEGTIEFYARDPKDPWQKAHDDLEATMLSLQGKEDYFKLLPRAVFTFDATISELIEKYRPFARGVKGSPMAFGFYNGTHATEAEAVENLEVRQSSRDRVCQCGEKLNLKIWKHPKYGIGVFCPPCREAVTV